MEKKHITIYDIAKEVKVSPATVSRVLTGNATVKEEKRLLVEDAIKRHNFQPNALARSLFKKETRTIGFILPNITNPFFSTAFFETEKFALHAGYTMILCDSMNNHEMESKYLNTLAERQVDAIVFMGGRVNDVKIKARYADELNRIGSRIPIVIVNGKMSRVNVYEVFTDENAGMIQLIEYMLGLGHKKIGIIGGVSSVTSTVIKQKAFCETLRKHGIDVNDEWIIPGDFSIESGSECIYQLLKQKDIPTALICINDFVAIGAIQAIKAAGLKVPEDISIAGFDGTYVSEIITPRLTTISQNYGEVGKTIIETITSIVKGEDTQREKIVETKLITGDSCRRL